MNDAVPPPGPMPPAAEPVPAAAPPPAGAPPSPPPGRSRRSRRRALTTGLAVLLCLGAAGSGTVYAVQKLDAADRTAPTVVWADSDETDETDEPDEPGRDGAEGKPEKSGAGAGEPGEPGDAPALAGRLLPMPPDHAPGPDIGEFGNDYVLTGQDARAVLKESGRDLPAKQRRERERALEKLRIEGLAGRTYHSEEHGTVAEIQIMRMKNRAGARELHQSYVQLYELLGIFRDGPRVKGHKNATCLLAPKPEKNGLTGMNCMAQVDDLLVTLIVSGAEPLPAKDMAGLMKDQLDHITAPGEYV
ncbi:MULTISPECIES: hypothetical protein [Streptomyces]|uniref:Uncharacterized protein n=1 Tax=Streptomyces xinghaiensis TaxID=1038928 RepID=A0A3R7IKD3_9ACTN|nr:MULTISPECIES: hypothetical protein [Streptomyces]OFA49681.1 hypothetical protein BEN35_16635 [Streptomyces fradiae]PQM19875.1 hypothetical protein Sfr7A_30220 [Streptomyces xinghaiensis]RKM90843.1 hypothetical protein SFRA_030725 [Streptomyces xinghaiensis]RNC68841.1 hypothetical protein DC095_031315 [Streptomyces xinghaiensis]